ncbi:hypothetical protein [Brevundimonas subvibrioides]|uniref:Peptidase M61 catalytic domain-containing protein n=1 Tax=Brevundimonas subvibrioides (strain ATCC 15264 / DSM 4735 / LMG 14903 / NBRC 16000 / CB 81) TaxID=633149 RepID=D9QN49_BRESC|nr:hypothetical protein [Brevundimonas subvibrioides]ADL00250.1 hypothetical protein Bresu_0937 [Brevundimonas subvibrioides ATCC 15264]
MLKLLVVVLALAVLAPRANGQAVPTARAVAVREGAGVVVRYHLPAPVRRVAFSQRDTIRELWTVTTPGLTLVDGVVSGEAPFEGFELLIRPDAVEVDRVYMGLTLAGDGRVLFGPALMLEGLGTTLSVDLAAGEAVLPAGGQIDGYAYIGLATDIMADARGAVVAGSNMPAELTDLLRHSFFDSMAFYEGRLGVGLPFRPTLIGSVDSPGPAAFRGDVTDTGVISVRFHGDAWRDEREAVGPFVWHETFHLWNGHSVKNRDSEAAPWLHEGGADYAAIVGAISSGAMGEAGGRLRIMRRVNGCRRLLGSDDLDPTRLQSGNGPYDCGVLIQWLVDLEARKAGTGDVFTVWRTLLAGDRSGPDGYGVKAFRALIGPDSAVSVLLDGPGTTRWATVRSRLADLGVSLENRPGDRDLRGAALRHVAGRNCSSAYGFYDNPGALQLDGADCGVLSGEPVIDTVEGYDPQTTSRAMFDAVMARCAEGMPVRYATRDGRVLEAICDRPLVEPEVWAIADAPALALGDENLSTVIK